MAITNRIILNIEAGIDDKDALSYVQGVVSLGKISNDDTQYCYLTSFEGGIKVYADKTNTGTNTFRIWRGIE